MESLFAYRQSYLHNKHKIDEWAKIDRSIHISSDESIFVLYNKTRYIKYDEMIKGIKGLIEALDKDQPYALFFPLSAPFKIGSENAIVLECFDELSKLNICEVITSDKILLGNNINLLIIDDAVYTGKNVWHIMDTFSGVLGFTVLSYAMSHRHEDLPLGGIKFNKCISFKTINDIMEEHILSSNPYSDPSTVKAIIASKMGAAGNTPAIYFDHKIHDSLVTLYTNDLFKEGCYPSRLPADCVMEIHRDIAWRC